jgi:hypothetical protein
MEQTVKFGGNSFLGLGPADNSPNRAAKRNLISGNTFIGVELESDGNTVAGNWIGLDATGTRSVAGSNIGVLIGGQANVIGTDSDGVNDALERNVISGNQGDAIRISGGNDNVVAGNYIGTDPNGTTIANLGNGPFTGGAGVFFSISGTGNRIGVNPAAANPLAGRNVISGSAWGVRLIARYPSEVVSGNVIAGNYIGTDRTGQVALGNLVGVDIIDATSNRIGGTTPAEGNVISGNSQVGVYIHCLSGVASNNQVLGNWIGTDPTGLQRPGLGNSSGVAIDNSASSNQIGGTDPGQGNTIAYNTAGVILLATAPGNSIRGNSIHDNVALGIDLGADGVTLNGSHAPGQPGPNNWQTFPVLASVVGGGPTHVTGTLDGVANTTFTLDFYANAQPAHLLNGQYYGEGQRWLGSASVTTDGSGHATFDVTTLAATAAGEWISATATGPSGTSEFAPAMKVPPPSSLSGVVFADFNHDGQVDFGEKGISGVPITLTGTDDLSRTVNLCQTTDADGTYVFLNLRPGTYTITETQQPAGYTPGINTVGTGGGTVSGAQFTGISLTAGENAMNYNYGEQPAAGGAAHTGQTAGIGFWNNKNGQALIKALNGGAGTQLGDWLEATFPHIFGAASGSNDLAGQNNAYVASFFQSRFVVHGQKLDAQVLATALAVYVTDSTLDNTGVGTQYGFVVSGNGVATSTYNVGTNGAAFGVADNTVMTVMDLLLAADAQAVNGVLYNGDTTKRNQANNVFSAINEAGSI